MSRIPMLSLILLCFAAWHLKAESLESTQGNAGSIYYVDPVKGCDTNSGLATTHPWQSFTPVNQHIFKAGDRVEIRPGQFNVSLAPQGNGTVESPVIICFAPGEYDFFPTNAIKQKLHISNNNDDPHTPKAIALLFSNTCHFRITGSHSDIRIHGKMIEVMLDHAKDITFSGLDFDYARPTVSEFTVTDTTTLFADVRVHPDSTYAIKNNKLLWIGEGWQSTGLGLTQEYDIHSGRVWRCASPLNKITKVEEIAPFQLRLWFDTNPGLKTNHVFQFRETFRDCCGGFLLRSKDILFRDCHFHFMHGLGIVSQFSENLTFDHVALAPRPGSGRTCAGWADLLHFSGCRGQILVNDCDMSGSNDDPINVHGTHLRIVGNPVQNQILVRFMHPQTYGFEAFATGDEIEFVNHDSLCAYATNHITAIEPKGEKEILLTLAHPISHKIGTNDVVENTTWTPAVTIRHCRITVDSCRGFLLTTRKPVLVESNTFVKTTMHAILIADDANSWFESGPVHDVKIHGNHFIECDEPVIAIAPENHTDKIEEPVHRNIRITNNRFDLKGETAISARSTQGLVIASNVFSNTQFTIQTNSCSKVHIFNNTTRQ